MTALSRIADLQCRYDGPIPQAELDAARGINTALLAAAGNARFFTRMARGQIEVVRYWRSLGRAQESDVAQLRQYLERRRYWRREVEKRQRS